MSKPIVIKSDDPIINKLDFKPFRSTTQRRVRPFMPKADEPQTIQVKTPWGAVLTAKKGDMLVSELNAPNDEWPVDAAIFDETYMVVGPELCVKRAVTMLVPMVDLTGGDEEQLVIVHSLEGPETVRAGDFFLAKGVKGEIWAYPKQKALAFMRPVE